MVVDAIVCAVELVVEDDAVVVRLEVPEPPGLEILIKVVDVDDLLVVEEAMLPNEL